MNSAIRILCLSLALLLTLAACGSGGAGQQAEPVQARQNPPSPEERFTALLVELWGLQDRAREMQEWQSKNDMFPFLRRFHELLNETKDLPGVFDDIHADYMLKLLRKHDAGLAGRMEKGELSKFVSYHFGGCWNQVYKPEGGGPSRCRTEYDAAPPVADREKDCAAYIAEFVRRVVDVRLMLESEAAEERALTIEKLSTEIFKTGIEEWTLGLHPEIDLPAKVRAIVAGSHPKVAEDFTAMLTSRNTRMAEYSQERARDRLEQLHRTEMEFRRTDPDRNGANDFWTADVSGLYRLKPRGRPIACVPGDIAAEDGSPLKEDSALGAMPRAADYRVYLLLAVSLDSEGKPLGTDTDGSGRAWRNRARFAFCAYPAVYGRGRRNTYLMDQTGTIWMKDTGGKAVERFPSNPEGDQWSVVREADGGEDLPTLSPEEEKTAIDGLIAELDGDEYRAQDAASALAVWGVRASRAVPGLLRILKGAGAYYRAGAARALGKIGASPSEALPVLLGIAKDDKEDMALRCECLDAVGEFGSDAAGAVGELRQLTASEAFDLRAAALRAMEMTDEVLESTRDFRIEGWVGLLKKKNLHNRADDCRSALLRIGLPAVPALEKIAADRVAGEDARKLIREIRRAAK